LGNDEISFGPKLHARMEYEAAHLNYAEYNPLIDMGVIDGFRDALNHPRLGADPF